MTTAAQYLAAYRSILRELARSSLVPRAQRNKAIATSVRSIFEDYRRRPEPDVAVLVKDVKNAAVYLHSQRMYMSLLERYNPLHDMSPEERVHATARRVGLDVPIECKGEPEKK